MRRAMVTAVGLAGTLAAATGSAQAATVPPHDPMNVLVVSDEVNPNNLSPAELTQPGDIPIALQNSASGLSIGSIDEVPSECIDDALSALSAGGIDVVIYFAHLGARGCDGSDQSAALTDAVEKHLRDGGGVVVFHHGSYADPGKNSILQLLGVTASSIEWNTAVGQDVIAVGAGHFIVDNGMTYAGMRSFSADALGVPAGEYGVFTNVPDERYPSLTYLTAPGEERTTLFASDYAGAVALSYDLRRPDWSGHVVLYQPGEYQPHALDDLSGPNFQILANAIYWVATTHDDPTDPTGGNDDSGDAGDSADATGGGMDDAAVDDSGGDGTGGGDGPNGATSDSGDTDASEDGDGSGCGCRTTDEGPAGAAWMLLVLAGLGATRRRG